MKIHEKRMKVQENGWKMDESEGKWIKSKKTERKWMKVDEIEEKRIKLKERE